VLTVSDSSTCAVSVTVEQVPLAQLDSESEVTYVVPLVNLSLWVVVSAGTLIVYVQLPVIVTGTVVPVEPDEGEGAHEPPIVQVKDGAPVSATVTSMFTVTVAAKAGCEGDRKTTKRRATPAKRIGLLLIWM